MRKLIPVLLLATVPCFAAITNIQATDATQREVILRYVAPSPAACTIEVSESPSFAPLVHDVNPSLFAGSNSDFRNGAQGRDRAFILGAAGTGINYAPVDLTGKRSSRALQVNTTHYYRLSCGADTATGTFRTANIAPGDTFPGTIVPIDPTALGDGAWPYLSWTGTGGVIDPITGVFIQRFRNMNERIASTDNPGLSAFNYVYDESANWINKTNLLADDGAVAIVSTPDPIRFYTNVRQNISTTSLLGLILQVHGFVDSVSTTTQACLSIDGATCYGPWIPFTLPVGTLGPVVSVGDTTSGAAAPMFGGWLNANQKLPTPFDTSARSGLADNTGAVLTMRAYGGGQGSFDYRWTPNSHIIYNGADYTVASVQSGTEITLSPAPGTNMTSKAWTAANFGFMIRRSSGTGVVSIDSAKFVYRLYSTYNTNGGSGGSVPCTSKRYPEGWRIGGPTGGTTKAATNTAPIVMTTTTDNDLQTGDVVKQIDVPGNTAANGTWTITRLSARTYSLNGSNGIGSGTFPSDGNGDLYVAYHGGGLVWKTNAATGVMCFVTDGTGGQNLYWVNPDTTPADVRYLGLGFSYLPGVFSQTGTGSIDTSDPDVPVAYNLITSGGVQYFYRGRYTGNRAAGLFRSIGTNTFAGENNGADGDTWNWINITPAPNSVTAKINAFDPTANEQTYNLLGGVKPGLFAFTGRAGGIQNSMGWLGVYDVVNNAVVGLMNSWKNSNARWCGIHTALPWPGADFFSFVPYELIGNNNGSKADWYGPYRLFPTSGSLNAAPTDCASQLAAIGQPNPLGVTGSKCTTITTTNVMPTSPANFTPANDTRNNTGIRVGDYFSINTASGGPSGIGLYDNERIRLLGYSGTTLVVQRGAAGTSVSAHGSGYNMNEFCSVVPLWWDYTTAPHGETGTDPYSQGLNGIFQDPPFTDESHYFTSNSVSISDSVGAGLFTSLSPPFTCSNTTNAVASYAFRNYPWPDHVKAPTSAYGCVQGNPEFDGVNGNGQGQYLEKHPSPVRNVEINQSFFDARPYQTYSVWQQSVSKVGTYVYKVTGYNEFQGFDEKRNKLYVAIGHRTAYDVSAAGFTLPDTVAYNYTYCLVHVAGECRAGSVAGEVYVNAPYVSKVPLGWQDNPGQYRCQVRHEQWSDLQLNDVCVAIQTADADYSVQYPLVHDPYNTGTRRITGSLAATRTSGNLYNAPVFPDGNWQVNWNGLVNDGANLMSMLVKVPPYNGPQRGTNRGSWIPVPVKLTSVPAGTNNVVVEFGYNPNFWCSTRQESCIANAATIPANVYRYSTSDTYSGLACSSGCTPVIPALAQRIMWYRVKYRNSSNQVINTGDVQTIATP